MTVTVPQFLAILMRMGSDVTYHREEGGTPCPCRTPEGFRDPAWHRAHPTAPICNEQGFLTVAVEFAFKGMVQPALSVYSRGSQRANDLLGDIQRDDRLGIFPCAWGGNTLNFEGWSEAGEDFIVYDGHRYSIVSADKLADVDGVPDHHWEVGLRLLTGARPSA
jgi:hypothetical protein